LKEGLESVREVWSKGFKRSEKGHPQRAALCEERCLGESGFVPFGRRRELKKLVDVEKSR